MTVARAATPLTRRELRRLADAVPNGASLFGGDGRSPEQRSAEWLARPLGMRLVLAAVAFTPANDEPTEPVRVPVAPLAPRRAGRQAGRRSTTRAAAKAASADPDGEPPGVARPALTDGERRFIDFLVRQAVKRCV